MAILKNDVLWQIAFWVCFAMVAVLSLWPNQSKAAHAQFDYLTPSGFIVHATAFAVLTLLAWQAFSRPVWLLALIIAAVSVAFETLQLLVPSRSFNPLDLAANAAGIVLALLITLFFD